MAEHGGVEVCGLEFADAYLEVVHGDLVADADGEGAQDVDEADAGDEDEGERTDVGPGVHGVRDRRGGGAA